MLKKKKNTIITGFLALVFLMLISFSSGMNNFLGGSVSSAEHLLNKKIELDENVEEKQKVSPVLFNFLSNLIYKFSN